LSNKMWKSMYFITFIHIKNKVTTQFIHDLRIRMEVDLVIFDSSIELS